MDGLVAEALRLLREAGCLDLLAEGVVGSARPTRRAAGSVAAAVAACSPPRSARKVEQQMRDCGRGRQVSDVMATLGRSATCRGSLLIWLLGNMRYACVEAGGGRSGAHSGDGWQAFRAREGQGR
ncbi:hypothetical protein NDU88_002612 [Pleurodeles waltl]|uniref:Uncharacterized protein n=1 Tax=Pleurodeles waltl TaxID=8319 RepID=A0AAV7WLP9_PLEWA|nr:hypothetical protein NDU88_002612 [Pleurodeles waltl]